MCVLCVNNDKNRASDESSKKMWKIKYIAGGWLTTERDSQKNKEEHDRTKRNINI